MTARDVDEVSLKSSIFTTIPWPGIYVYNATQSRIHRNVFQSVAPRSLVFKSGQLLEVIQNALDVTSALDVSQFERLSIFCNQPFLTELPSNCAQLSDGNVADIKVKGHLWTFIGWLSTFLGHLWLIILISAVAFVSRIFYFLLVSANSCFSGIFALFIHIRLYCRVRNSLDR